MLVEYLQKVSIFVSKDTLSRSQDYRSIPRSYTSIRSDGTTSYGMPLIYGGFFIPRTRQQYAMRLVFLFRLL